jgi:hypothetical protein
VRIAFQGRGRAYALYVLSIYICPSLPPSCFPGPPALCPRWSAVRVKIRIKVRAGKIGSQTALPSLPPFHFSCEIALEQCQGQLSQLVKHVTMNSFE